MEKSESLKLFVVFSKSFRAVSKYIEEDIRSYGLNPTEFAVLELLFNKGDHPIQQIGGKILLSSSSLTYVVDKLVNKGLIKRVSCQKDRRVMYASITPLGKNLIKEIFPNHKAVIENLMSCLSHNEQKQLIDSLKTLGLFAKSRI